MFRNVTRRLAQITLLSGLALTLGAGTPQTQETAVFAGGCFWGVDAVFKHVKGVISVTSGYAGGTVKNPDYEMVSSGTTGHAETVKIIFDPAKVTYATLLKVFFTVAHDPTELNYQGPDHGTQYRSVVFYTTAEQHKTVTDYIAQLTKAKTYSQPIVTQVVPFTAFYDAEEYHQNFFAKNPTHGYILAWDKPKVEHLKSQFPELYTGK